MAATGLLILLILAGCATPTPDTVYVEQAVPVELSRDCPIPVIRARTNGELAETVKQLEQALVLCNLDKASIRALDRGSR